MFNKLIKNDFIKQSLLVTAGATLANCVSYFYHLVMGRMLGPIGYGELGSLMSIYYLFNVPTSIVQIFLVKKFSEIYAKGSLKYAKSLLVYSLSALLVTTMVFGIVMLAATNVISSFLKLSDSRFVILLYLTFSTSVIIIPFMAFLQGFQRFMSYVYATNVWNLLRLGFGYIASFFGVFWVLGSNSMSNIAGIIATLAFTGFIFREKIVSYKPNISKEIRTFVLTTLGLLGVTSLYSTDVILVKHFFSARDAGIYTSLSVLGKIIFFASYGITTVLFPQIVKRNEEKKPYKNIIIISAITIISISLVIDFVFYLFPDITVRMLFGRLFDEASQYVGYFGIFILFVTLATALIQSCVAVNKFFGSYLIAGISILQIILIVNFHASIMEIININILVSFLGVLLLSLIIFFPRRNQS